MSNETRIIELEIKQSYQEDLVQELNNIVIQQQKQIDRLEKLVLELSNNVQSILTDLDKPSAEHEIPPHY